MTRERNKLAWRAAGSLAAGVVLTVAVAWGLAVWVRVPREEQHTIIWQGGNLWAVKHSAEWGAANAWWRPYWMSPDREALDTMLRWNGLDAVAAPGDALPGMREGPLPRRHGRRAIAGPNDPGWVEHARGWPFLSLWCESDHVPSEPAFRGGLDIPALRYSRDRSSYALSALPLRPLWGGFALSTAFYAGAVLLLWTAPGALVRRRLSRGQCPACGYDLRSTPGSPCPECEV